MTPATLDAALQRMAALVDWERLARQVMVVDGAPVDDLLTRLGRPHQRWRSVHVAGSKGKGSVCALVAAGLQGAGWRTGAYLSPHVHRIHERVLIDGQPIGDGELARALTAALDARDRAQAEGTAGGAASWFDVMTAAAFDALAVAGVDWAVVEVGLGGRDDSTNAVQPELAVITNIGLEHTEVLGHTLAQVAAAKAGIVKAGAGLVTAVPADSEAGHVIAEAARRVAVAPQWVPVPPGGSPATTNLALAHAALRALGARGHPSLTRATPLGDDDLPPDRAARVQLPGRLQRLTLADGTPLVVDGAHVDFALAAVLDALREQADLTASPVVLLALGADKDAQAMLAVLATRARHVVCVPLSGGRACWSADALAARALQAGLAAEAAPTAQAGLQRCLAQTQKQAHGGWILATGSLHLAAALAEAVPALAGRP
jgi:dihydrofolate synthase / folylpolyglutamate synthase